MTIFLGFCLALSVGAALAMGDVKASGHVAWHVSAMLAARMVVPWSLPLAIVYAMLVTSGYVGVCP